MIDFYSNPPATDENQIARLEASLGASLPGDYRDFLLCWNGGFSKEYGVEFSHWIYPKIEELGLMTWAGVQPGGNFFDIEKAWKAISDSVPLRMLPIAEATSDHLFLLSVYGDDRGSVYAFDPQLNGEKSLKKLSGSFADFCKMLKPDPEE